MPVTGQTLRAGVSYAFSEVGPATRILHVRLEADNPGFVLGPDMFVNVELPVAAPEILTVPVDALLDTELTKRIFVDTEEGWFEPREVVVGWRAAGRAQIISGLQ